MNILKYPLMNDEPAAGGSGGDAAASAPVTPAPAAGGGPSALATGGEKPVPIHERIPEKYRVFGEGDAFNLEASAQKLADAYGHLEKRLGSGDVPPESPEKYEIDGKELGEGFDVKAFMSDEQNQSFLKRAHALGMTNKQVQMVTEYALKEFAPQLAQGNRVLDSDGAIAALKADTWKTDAELQENMGAALRAFKSLPESLQTVIDKDLGNNPEFIKVMALFGREMREDSSPAQVTVQGDRIEIEKLMMSDAYKNTKNPEHERVSKQVRDYFERQK